MPLDYAVPIGTSPVRSWFGIGVRLIGLWELVSSVDEFVTYVNVLQRLYAPSVTSPTAYLTHAVTHLLVGSTLLFFAPSIVRAVYPSADDLDAGGPPTDPRQAPAA